jgi:hypothetical protein
MELENYYFISCGKEKEEMFSDLEELLQRYQEDNKVEVQHSFHYIATVAAKIKEENVIGELAERGYRVEPQNILRQLYPEQF